MHARVFGEEIPSRSRLVRAGEDLRTSNVPLLQLLSLQVGWWKVKNLEFWLRVEDDDDDQLIIKVKVNHVQISDQKNSTFLPCLRFSPRPTTSAPTSADAFHPLNNVLTLAEAFASRKQDFVENSRNRIRIVGSVRSKPKEFDRPTAGSQGSHNRLCQPYSHQHHLAAGGGKSGRRRDVDEKWEDEENDENRDLGFGGRGGRGGGLGGSQKRHADKNACHSTADGFCHPTNGHSNAKTKSQLDSLNREKKGKISAAKSGNKYHQKIAEEGKRKEEEERKKAEMRKTNKIRAEVFKEKLLNHVLDKAAKKKLTNGDGSASKVKIKCQTCGGKQRTC